MEFISHRVNKIEELKTLQHTFGVEIDLRDDFDGRIYMEHDPFKKGDDFEEYLGQYKHGTMILNIKSERIEYKVLELLKKHNIKNYFFLDSSFPMIKALSDLGERNIALRYSEYEGIDTICNMKGKINWVWVDCFEKFPLNYDSFKKIKDMGYKLCMVSPELQGKPTKIDEYSLIMKNENILFDAICTKSKNIDLWIEKLKNNINVIQ